MRNRRFGGYYLSHGERKQMHKLNIFHHPELPYEPLPKVAYDAARISILRRNFPEKGFMDEYSFSTRSKEHTIKVNVLIFAHSTHRNPAEYASFTIHNAVNGLSDYELVKILAESSALFHIIHRDNHFSFWASSLNRANQVEPILVQADIAYDQVDSVLSNYSDDLQPQRIINVKQGRETFTLPIFRDNIQPLQLSLWATDVTRKLLVDHFALAVERLRKYARTRRDIGAYDEQLTSLAIQLLGALILADTGALGDKIRLNPVSMRELLQKAHESFDRYFQLDLFENYYEAAEEAYQILREIRYAGFVPDMLSDLYTKAYSKEQRRKLGRFDTPLYLTRRILENIPIEYLPPDQRVIADMTGGWGSFLIAGYERLSTLIDTKRSLREQLHGNDIDPFTAQLEGLGLLLSTLEDSWHVDHEDALDWEWLDIHKPNVIVGNPPFGSIQDASVTGKDGWYEESNRFLEHAIERLAPNGYLAMLMPRSFTSTIASPQLRKKILEECDVFELWELPTGVFSGATARTVVIFAQKRSAGQGFSRTPVRVRTVQPQTLEDTKSSGIFTFTASSLVADQSNWYRTKKPGRSKNRHIFDYQIILPEYAWRTIHSQSSPLQNYIEITKGASAGKAENRKSHPFPKQVHWLTGVKEVMPRPFYINYEAATIINYPNDLERPRQRKEYILAGEKVIVVYDPDTTWGKRVKLAIEREDHYVSDSYWVIAPNALARAMSLSCEVIAAVMNWDVSNAWIVEHLKSPAIPKRAIETIPFPKDLSEYDCYMLTEAVRKLEDAARLGSSASIEVTQTIDAILKKAYHLDDATFERLRKVIEWDEQPYITLDPEPDRDSANWIISGVVDNIDAQQGTITLWVEGFRELQTVQIVPSMPGWLLRPNAAFRTKIPRAFVKQSRIDKDTVDWGMFQPQPYVYMNEEELFEELGSLLHADDKNRI